ncbi:MAG: hypothetical protein WBD95_13910 [Xanthobacteraceae bacterium]
MAKKSREDEKAKVNAPSPHDQQWDRDDELRKRHFDVDRIMDKSSQALLIVSLEFKRIGQR